MSHKGTRDRALPNKFIKTKLGKDQVLLVELTVNGQPHRNYRFPDKHAFLVESFSVRPVISDCVPPNLGFCDLDTVLPKLACFVTCENAVTQSLADHLWFVGIEVDLYTLGTSFDPTGQRFGCATKKFRWYLKGGI